MRRVTASLAKATQTKIPVKKIAAVPTTQATGYGLLDKNDYLVAIRRPDKIYDGKVKAASK